MPAVASNPDLEIVPLWSGSELKSKFRSCERLKWRLGGPWTLTVEAQNGVVEGLYQWSQICRIPDCSDPDHSGPVGSGSRITVYIWDLAELGPRSRRVGMRSSRVRVRSSRLGMRFSRMGMRSSRVALRSSRVGMRSSRVGWNIAEWRWDLAEWGMWTRSRRVVRESDCQCRSRNCLGFDPNILRHSGIWGVSEAVMNHKVRKIQKIPLKKQCTVRFGSLIVKYYSKQVEVMYLTQLTQARWLSIWQSCLGTFSSAWAAGSSTGTRFQMMILPQSLPWPPAATNIETYVTESHRDMTGYWSPVWLISPQLMATNYGQGNGWLSLVARRLTTAALWVRIQTTLKNTKWAT